MKEEGRVGQAHGQETFVLLLSLPLTSHTLTLLSHEALHLTREPWGSIGVRWFSSCCLWMLPLLPSHGVELGKQILACCFNLMWISPRITTFSWVCGKERGWTETRSRYFKTWTVQSHHSNEYKDHDPLRYYSDTIHAAIFGCFSCNIHIPPTPLHFRVRGR